RVGRAHKERNGRCLGNLLFGGCTSRKLMQRRLFNVRKYASQPGCAITVDAGAVRRRKRQKLVMMIVQRQADLLAVVLALGSERRLTDLLNGWEKQADQDRNDCDDHQ